METRLLLRKELASHSSLSFPHDCADEELSNLHAELAEYDGYIAGLIESLLRGRKVNPEALQYDEDLQGRLNTIMEADNESLTAIAKDYLGYLLSIKEVIQTARQYLQER